MGHDRRSSVYFDWHNRINIIAIVSADSLLISHMVGVDWLMSHTLLWTHYWYRTHCCCRLIIDIAHMVDVDSLLISHTLLMYSLLISHTYCWCSLIIDIKHIVDVNSLLTFIVGTTLTASSRHHPTCWCRLIIGTHNSSITLTVPHKTWPILLAFNIDTCRLSLLG